MDYLIGMDNFFDDGFGFLSVHFFNEAQFILVTFFEPFKFSLQFFVLASESFEI